MKNTAGGNHTGKRKVTAGGNHTGKRKKYNWCYNDV